MTVSNLKIVYRDPKALVAYGRNSRRHSKEQIEAIRRSIREFGFTNPVLIKDDGETIGAGHARVQAALAEGVAKVPTILLKGLTDAQWRAYVIADNELSLTATWDADLLRAELLDLKALDFDLSLIGFPDAELQDIFSEGARDGVYSPKLDPPIYTPSGEVHRPSALTDETKTKVLKAEIAKAKIPKEIAAFLQKAADRHTVFDFHKIADFYASATPEVQRLMEKSALVIIDFNAAIENGFVNINDRLRDLASGMKVVEDEE